jgi:formate dehydrogenase subunit gamma
VIEMRATGRRLVRYRFGERVLHAAAAVSYVYLLLTGLAFWTPALYWMAIVLGGGFLTRAVHPWAGLIFSAIVIWMFAAWRRDMRTTDTDRAWRKALLAYVRNDDHLVPAAGRFNFGQKSFFWIIFWATLVLLLSGLVLWQPQLVPWRLRFVREAAVLLHAVAALVTIGAFIVHIYMGLAVVPEGLGAILHGEVTEEWARHHHPLWVDQASGAASASRTAAGGRPLPG